MSTHADTSSSSPLPRQPACRNRKKALPYSDLDVSQWRNYDNVETGTLWLFNNRQREQGHKLDYHGNCIPQILTQVLTRFTRQGDVIIDPFVGSGTSAIEAVNLDRLAIGIDIQAKMIEHIEQKLKEQNKTGSVRLIEGNSANWSCVGASVEAALREFGKSQAQHLFLHPPYADIIRFSEEPGDLSSLSSTAMFLDAFEQVARWGFNLLENNRFATLVIGDKYSQKELIPLGFYCMERMNRVGFQTKSIIVKNMTGNERGKGKTTNLWRYRALAGGFYIFKHEYVMIFEKPAKRQKNPTARKPFKGNGDTI
ncbi:MAG: DNA methyltransferase [Candidatus Melainabacteria bacterium]|nr:DNA methyltransferase [Candidatus Melainabacteria bacterium]